MLKKITLIIILFFAFAFSTFAESIKNYEVKIFLNKDASMDVVEEINYDFGNIQRHGIFRFIPNHFSVKGQEKLWGMQERELKFFNLEVFRDGERENIAEIDEDDGNGNYFIKIGSPSRTFSGLHKYKIKYKVQGSLRYFKDFDEIYWNAIGLDWKVPIEKAKIVLESDGVKFKNKSCYQGKLRSKKSCNIQGNIFESTEILNPYDGLSIAASFPKGAVEKVEIWSLSKRGWMTIIFSSLIGIIGYIFISIRKFLNKFKSDKPIIPIYRPYKNYHPALTGFLIDKKFDPQDITAGILSLAQKGIIEIEKIEEKGILFGTNSDYIFRLKKTDEEIETLDELDKMFLKLIFSKNDDFETFLGNLSDTAQKFVINDVDGIYKEMRLSTLKDRAESIYSQRENIKEWLIKYAKKNRFLEALWGGSFLVNGNPLFRFTEQGWKVKNNLEGFKMFLNFTEKERIEMFNAPELNPKQFFEYLPYATAFGVEKKWKRQFDNITLPRPDWYSGTGTFTASAFLNDISSISSISDIATSTVATTASSSSGSFGGGFSGGGSGGGGGGSW